jgi:hypothetical protein
MKSIPLAVLYEALAYTLLELMRSRSLPHEFGTYTNTNGMKSISGILPASDSIEEPYPMVEAVVMMKKNS